MSGLLGQQLDMFGGRTDVMAATDTLRLFDSARQMRGQMNLDTDRAGVLQRPRARQIARRVPITEARQWFDNGGTVAVSTRSEQFFEVGRQTTTHDRNRVRWDALVADVRVWRNRYPNQRFYIVSEEEVPHVA